MNKCHFIFDKTRRSKRFKKIVLQKYNNFSLKKSNVIIVEGDWEAVNLGTYDGIFYDTDMDDRTMLFSSSLSDLTKSGTKFTFWNSNTNESNIFNIESTYKQVSVTPAASSSQYFQSGSTTYYMPMKEF